MADLDTKQLEAYPEAQGIHWRASQMDVHLSLVECILAPFQTRGAGWIPYP